MKCLAGLAGSRMLGVRSGDLRRRGCSRAQSDLVLVSSSILDARPPRDNRAKVLQIPGPALDPGVLMIEIPLDTHAAGLRIRRLGIRLPPGAHSLRCRRVASRETFVTLSVSGLHGDVRELER